MARTIGLKLKTPQKTENKAQQKTENKEGKKNGT